MIRTPATSLVGAIAILGPITGPLVVASFRFARAGRPRLAALCAAGVVATPFMLTAVAAWVASLQGVG
jgi:hypothetical protein